MRADFHAVAAGVWFVMVRGWRWLAGRSRASGDHRFRRQFFLALLGLSAWPDESDFEVWSINEASPTALVADSSPTHRGLLRGFTARRAPSGHLGTRAKGRPRDPHSRVHRRSAFRAENPLRIHRMR
jgi:hypothetical protein